MEILLGNPKEKMELKFQIDNYRLFFFTKITEKYGDIHFIPLTSFLSDNNYSCRIDISLFQSGLKSFYKYLSSFNSDCNFLPLDRVFVGIKPKKHKDEIFNDFGGYYSKYQAYYHLEQISLTSILGTYCSQCYSTTITTLELLRSYFHDSIHYNTFRSYKLKFNHPESEINSNDIHRFQYGFNFRKEDGKSFSKVDSPNSFTTRNLGLIMEGVTDDFSKIAINYIIKEMNISFDNINTFESFILNEITNLSLNEVKVDYSLLTDTEKKYVNKIEDSYNQVWVLYYNFLNEFAKESKQEFRDLSLNSMLNGDYFIFRDYFNNLMNDVDGFDKLFRSSSY